MEDGSRAITQTHVLLRRVVKLNAGLLKCKLLIILFCFGSRYNEK